MFKTCNIETSTGKNRLWVVHETFGIPESLCNESTKIINKNFNIVKEIVNKQILVQKKYEEDNYER